MKDHSTKIKQLSKLIYQPLNLPLCSIHSQFFTPANLICIKSSCSSYMSLFCPNCSHPQTHLTDIQKIPTHLSQLLQDKWHKIISQQNIKIEHEWNTCSTNISYCIDILNEIKSMIANTQKYRLIQLPVFEHFINIVNKLFKDANTLDQITQNLQILNNKYGIFIINQSKQYKYQHYPIFNADCLDQDIEFRKQKWLKIGQKCKRFSQKALAFSQTLAQSVQNKLKYQKKKFQFNPLLNNKTTTLFQLLQQYQNNKDNQSFTSKMEQLSFLKIQLPSTNTLKKKPKKHKVQQQQNYLQKYLQKCTNLTSLLINNKNGKISSKIWQILFSKFQYLKNLTNLHLHLHNEQQLNLLIKLIKQRPHSVRQISILHLIITDQQKLNLKQIAIFCNCFQLKQLYLTLTRNNITKISFLQFIHLLKVNTSLSYLPMNILQINITKNKISKKQDQIQCHTQFINKSQDIKKKLLLL